MKMRSRRWAHRDLSRPAGRGCHNVLRPTNSGTASPGSAPCFGYCSYPVAPPVAEQALRPHVYAPSVAPSTALHISHRTLVARLQEAGLVRLTTQETQERMLHARANVHAAPELVT
jgi:hypothetical protein